MKFDRGQDLIIKGASFVTNEFIEAAKSLMNKARDSLIKTAFLLHIVPRRL